MLDNRYEVTSNREAGEGRYDICLIPRQKRLPGILIELKASKDCKEDHLKSLAKEALNQIDQKLYAQAFSNGKASHIVKYGVAFSGKKVEIETENNISD